MGRKKGKSYKKNKMVGVEEDKKLIVAPHSFVIHRGLPCSYIMDLTKDFRRMMEPYTASSLRERRSNKIKDFVSLSGIFHVSHMCIFNKSTNQLSFKVGRLPRGPTLSFKVHQFSLARDVISFVKKQFYDEDSFINSPLVILNNFTGEGNHIKLMAHTFQNMFPSINVATVELSTIRRCVMFSFNPLTKLIDIRHYSVTVIPVGVSKGVKKVVMGKVPNMAKLNDISDYLVNCASDSEMEDDEKSQVTLPQTLKSRGNIENFKSSVRLHEIGPRLTIELMKIEGDLCTGEILYHNTIIKSEEEVALIKKERIEKKLEKERRRKVQEKNKIKKMEQKEFKVKDTGAIVENLPDYEKEDDAEYYKEEVGLEPDKELFTTEGSSNRRPYMPKYMQKRNAKRNNKSNGNLDKKNRNMKGSLKNNRQFGKSNRNRNF